MAVISVINIQKNRKKAELTYFLNYLFNNICLNKKRGRLFFSLYESFLSFKYNKDVNSGEALLETAVVKTIVKNLKLILPLTGAQDIDYPVYVKFPIIGESRNRINLKIE